jgi:hypothetical protein
VRIVSGVGQVDPRDLPAAGRRWRPPEIDARLLVCWSARLLVCWSAGLLGVERDHDVSVPGD